MLTKHDLDLKKAIYKILGSNNGVCFARSPKSKTSPGKVVVTFSDIVFCDEPRVELTGFQILELGAYNSSMALVYEHSSV